jgi:hypothetical protein
MKVTLEGFQPNLMAEYINTAMLIYYLFSKFIIFDEHFFICIGLNFPWSFIWRKRYISNWIKSHFIEMYIRGETLRGDSVGLPASLLERLVQLPHFRSLPQRLQYRIIFLTLR